MRGVRLHQQPADLDMNLTNKKKSKRDFYIEYLVNQNQTEECKASNLRRDDVILCPHNGIDTWEIDRIDSSSYRYIALFLSPALDHPDAFRLKRIYPIDREKNCLIYKDPNPIEPNKISSLFD